MNHRNRPTGHQFVPLVLLATLHIACCVVSCELQKLKHVVSCELQKLLHVVSCEQQKLLHVVSCKLQKLLHVVSCELQKLTHWVSICSAFPACTMPAALGVINYSNYCVL